MFFFCSFILFVYLLFILFLIIYYFWKYKLSKKRKKEIRRVIFILGQFDALQEELERRREECIQLRSVLADNTRRMKSLGSNYGRDVDIINEDGELVLAFEAQKKINR